MGRQAATKIIRKKQPKKLINYFSTFSGGLKVKRVEWKTRWHEGNQNKQNNKEEDYFVKGEQKHQIDQSNIRNTTNLKKLNYGNVKGNS